MKKILVLLVALVVQKNFAQNVFPATGNVGIGTNSPTAKLETLNTTAGITSFRTIGVNGSILVDNVGSGENYYNATKFHEFQIGGASKVRINSNGNVGIGTISPNARLDLGSGYGSSGAKFLIYNDDSTSELSGTKCGFYMDNFRLNNLNLVFPEAISYPGLFTISAKNTSGTTLNPYFSIAGMTGFVGIGTTNPVAPLTVYGKSVFFPARIGSGDARSFVVDHTASNPAFISNDYPVVLKTGGGDQPLILDASRIGIGTSNPDEKLTVKGKIHTQEVKVDMQGPLVPDYVFANDYKLKSLQQVENYIKENNHLPEIPSAKEIEKNGLMLAEMNMSLLKKIEELTLYAIEQQKNTEKLIQLLDEQNKRLKILEEGRK